MELVTEKLTVKIDGVVHELSYPTVKQLRELDKKKDNVDVDAICGLVKDAGMPVDVVENLQASHLNQIVEALMGKGK
jgi:ribosome maturation protein Sdo1